MTELTIRPIRKKDHEKAIQFAIKGMHFDACLENRTLLYLYGRYFWYSELLHSTQVIAAYEGDRLTGVLLADMKGEKKAYHSFWNSLYCKLIDFVQNTFYKKGVGPYSRANQEMYRAYAKSHSLSGEICFLAADPDRKIPGVGTLLLRELERRERGKRIYLYTDSNCTWQFYEHRGFARVGDVEIGLEFDEKGDVPLSCYLYSKVCGSAA